MRNHLVVMLSLALTACGGGGSDTGSASDTENDEDSNSNSNSGTIGVTLGNTMSGTEGDTEPTSSSPSTTVDPTTSTDPTTTTDPDSSGTTTGDTEATTESSGSESGSTGDDGGATIYEIQMGTIVEDTDVEVFSVIVTAVGTSGFWAEEPAGGEYSGILVYAGAMYDALGVADLELGDIVDFTGTVVEFSDLTEINISGASGTLNVTGSGPELAPDVVDISVFNAPLTAEPWESTLVRIEGTFTVTNDGVNGFDEYVVSDGTDEVTIDNFIWNSTDEDTGLPGFGTGAGATFDAIQGPVNYFNDTFKIMPRAESDFEGYEAP